MIEAAATPEIQKIVQLPTRMRNCGHSDLLPIKRNRDNTHGTLAYSWYRWQLLVAAGIYWLLLLFLLLLALMLMLLTSI